MLAQSEWEEKAEGTVGGGRPPGAARGGRWRSTGGWGWGKGSGTAPAGAWCESAAEGGGKCMGGTWAWSRPGGAGVGGV